MVLVLFHSVSRYKESCVCDEFGEQVFAFLDCNASPAAIICKLVAVYAANREITGFRMTDEESADGGRGLNTVMVGQGDVEPLLSIQAVEDDALQRVVGARCIAEGNTQRPVHFWLPLAERGHTPIKGGFVKFCQPLGTCFGQAGTKGMRHQLPDFIGRFLFRTSRNDEKSDG